MEDPKRYWRVSGTSHGRSFHQKLLSAASFGGFHRHQSVNTKTIKARSSVISCTQSQSCKNLCTKNPLQLSLLFSLVFKVLQLRILRFNRLWASALLEATSQRSKTRGTTNCQRQDISADETHLGSSLDSRQQAVSYKDNKDNQENQDRQDNQVRQVTQDNQDSQDYHNSQDKEVYLFSQKLIAQASATIRLTTGQ
jgi:hypothetical protein